MAYTHDKIKRKDFFRDTNIAIVFLLVGLVLSPLISQWWIEDVANTPERLAKLLKNADIEGFSEVRKHVNTLGEFDNIDLSERNLSNARLDSVIITNANLSKTDLSYSRLDKLKVSGDLSGVIMINSSLFRADLSNSDLTNADLTGANLTLTNLNKIYAPSSSLKKAYLREADLTGADLRGAELDDAYFGVLLLENTFFSCQSLIDAKLTKIMNSSNVRLFDEDMNEVDSCS